MPCPYRSLPTNRTAELGTNSRSQGPVECNNITFLTTLRRVLNTPNPNPPKLSVNNRLVLAALKAAGKPITAYDLLDRLREEGLRGPPTVYRALGKLIEIGLVHKLESLNAFVVCTRDCHRNAAAFMVCNECGVAAEFDDENLDQRIGALAAQSAFAVDTAILELRGRCGNCSRSSHPSPRDS